jgi:DNA-binding GntR family transcriptional regulator
MQKVRRAVRRVERRPSLYESSYVSIREAILRRDLAPEQRLLEAELAKELGVSRNPVREALRLLQQDGLVEVRPHGGGAYVTRISGLEAGDVYRIRGALEGVAAALAAERINDRELDVLSGTLERMYARARKGDAAGAVRDNDSFHRTIYAAARSKRLNALLEQIYAQMTHLRNVTMRMPGRAEEALRGHAAIADALKRHDPALAEEVMRKHIHDAHRALLRHLETDSTSRSQRETAT